MKNTIQISLTEFINFVNKSGSAKATVVKSAKKSREGEGYNSYADYWLPFREKLKLILRQKKGKESLDDLLKKVSSDKKDNYRKIINGFKKFWGRKDFEWVNIPRKTWIISDLRVVLNPEIGIAYRDKIYVIKLFLNINEVLDKKHADQILTLLEKELRIKVGEGDEVVFGVLDVKKGKLFKKEDHDLSLYSLLKGEAMSFQVQWKDL